MFKFLKVLSVTCIVTILFIVTLYAGEAVQKSFPEAENERLLRFIDVVIVDNCEYIILGDGSHGSGICHKENCKNHKQ